VGFLTGAKGASALIVTPAISADAMEPTRGDLFIQC